MSSAEKRKECMESRPLALFAVAVVLRGLAPYLLTATDGVQPHSQVLAPAFDLNLSPQSEHRARSLRCNLSVALLLPHPSDVCRLLCGRGLRVLLRVADHIGDDALGTLIRADVHRQLT